MVASDVELGDSRRIRSVVDGDRITDPGHVGGERGPELVERVEGAVDAENVIRVVLEAVAHKGSRSRGERVIRGVVSEHGSRIRDKRGRRRRAGIASDGVAHELRAGSGLRPEVEFPAAHGDQAVRRAAVGTADACLAQRRSRSGGAQIDPAVIAQVLPHDDADPLVRRGRIDRNLEYPVARYRHVGDTPQGWKECDVVDRRNQRGCRTDSVGLAVTVVVEERERTVGVAHDVATAHHGNVHGAQTDHLEVVVVLPSAGHRGAHGVVLIFGKCRGDSDGRYRRADVCRRVVRVAGSARDRLNRDDAIAISAGCEVVVRNR